MKKVVQEEKKAGTQDNKKPAVNTQDNKKPAVKFQPHKNPVKIIKEATKAPTPKIVTTNPKVLTQYYK